MNKDQDWGVISQLEVEADTFTTLKAVCMIALTEHQAKGFSVKTDVSAPDQLEIVWTTGNDLRGSDFLCPITDAEELANMIWKWLSTPKRYQNCKKHDTDGDLKQGYKISMSNLSHWNVMFKVIPEYIIYGK